MFFYRREVHRPYHYILWVLNLKWLSPSVYSIVQDYYK
jgi:hypothetical protein